MSLLGASFICSGGFCVRSGGLRVGILKGMTVEHQVVSNGKKKTAAWFFTFAVLNLDNHAK